MSKCYPGKHRGRRRIPAARIAYAKVLQPEQAFSTVRELSPTEDALSDSISQYYHGWSKAGTLLEAKERC